MLILTFQTDNPGRSTPSYVHISEMITELDLAKVFFVCLLFHVEPMIIKCFLFYHAIRLHLHAKVNISSKYGRRI